MALTVEQALVRAMVCRKNGKLGQAKRLYRAIIEVEPTHPAANHNLGMSALSLGKGGDALPLRKNALKSDQSARQYWVSYIEALLALQRYDEAERASG